MAHNKLIDVARRGRAECRDQRRLQATGPETLDAAAAPQQPPSEIVTGRELLQQVRERRSERYLMDQRALDRAWASIAAEVGGTPDGVRMQSTRALDRVTWELGLAEVADE